MAKSVTEHQLTDENAGTDTRDSGPACTACQHRSVRCSRGRPCTNCVRRHDECDYIREWAPHSERVDVNNADHDAPAGSGEAQIGSEADQGSYPEPEQTALDPYPALAQHSGVATGRGSGNVGVYGVFPGPHAAQSNLTTNPNVALTEAQRAARDFHILRGDPGAHSSSSSALAGHYADCTDGGPGRDGVREAWRQAITYGGTRAYDEDFTPFDIDGTEKLFEEADRPTTRGGITKGRGRGGWRKLLKGTEHADVGRTAAATTKRGMPNPRGRPGKGVRGGRRSKPIDPGHDFKRLMQEASKAYFDQDYEEAADNCRQAIGINPEIFQAHSLLSQILQAQGRREDSLAALKFGAPTVRSAEIWEMLAVRLLDIPHEQHTKSLLRDAIDCYTEAIKVTRPEDAQLHLRARKYELYKALNDSKAARMDCKNILRIWPHKTFYVREFAQLCAAWYDKSELKRAFEEYEAAFGLYQKEGAETFGDEDDPTDPWEHLNTYLELSEMVADPWTSLKKAKQIARWFLGRREETFWDRYSEDDREFDVHNERRAYVPEWQMGKASRDNTQYGECLPIEIRVRLGMLRLKMGLQHHEEALRHFRPLLLEIDAIEDFWEVFLQVAQALRSAGFLKEAAEFFDPLRTYPDAENKIYGLEDKVWMALATCYHALRRVDDAIACYEVVVGRQGDDYGRASASLAKLYEDNGDLDKARFICQEFIAIGRHDLLIDAGVKMVPEAVRKLPAKIPIQQYIPSGKITPSIKPRIPRQPPKPILPAGVEPGSLSPQLLPDPMNIPARKLKSNSTKAPKKTTLGPTSREIELPEAPKTRVNAGRSRNKRKRDQFNILEAICGPVDDPELVEEIERQGPILKRPRLTKKPTAVTKAQAKEHSRQQLVHDVQARVHAYYATVKRYWEAAKGGNDESLVEKWIDAAVGMLADFTSMKVFFPYRDKNMALRCGEAEDSDKFFRDPKGTGSTSGFLSIPFAEWHRICVDLALFYARNAEQDKCYRIVQDVLFGANVFFQNSKLKWTQYGAAIHCAQVFNDSQYLIELSRDIIKEGDCRSGEGYQLFAAVNRFSFGSNWFSAGPTQKFMLRQVKFLDYLAMDTEMRKRFDWSAQAPVLERKGAGPVDERSDLFPGVLLTYGHMVAVANHSFSALPYYYRALALQPDNICVNLSIAAMWVQNSMKRQVPNRQFGITQGLSFLYRYYDLRVASGQVCDLQEAEYNTARMWHYLGLTHLAMPAYENVLGLSQQVQEEAKWIASAGQTDNRVSIQDDGTVKEDHQIEDFAQEAAFALQGLYALVGNDEAARAVTEDWLVI